MESLYPNVKPSDPRRMNAAIWSNSMEEYQLSRSSSVGGTALSPTSLRNAIAVYLLGGHKNVRMFNIVWADYK